ncbi:MAG: transposase [Spirochaetales bacterium]|nr:transposase [Spirochaetales bacterium]
MFEILFNSVNESIQSWTKKYGNYIPRFYIVLHTFGSDIKFNPHFHVLITDGGLRIDKKKWKSAPDNYLMPEAHLFSTIGPQLY